jgi:hypothetical protein
VNNALIACPLSVVKPIRAADIALRPFGNWPTIADDQGLNPSDFHQTAMDVFAMRQRRRPLLGRAALTPKVVGAILSRRGQSAPAGGKVHEKASGLSL